MNNIQKNFKAKRGLCMAVGGIVDPLENTQFAGMDRTTAAQHTNDPAVLNAAGGDKVNRYLDYSPAASTTSYKQPDSISTLDLVKQQAKPAQQVAPQPAAKPVAQPVETTFGEDPAARSQRMDGYVKDLTGMRNKALGLADGTGSLPETPEQVMARMAAKYGTTGAAQTSAPVAQPAPVQAAPQPAPKPPGLLDRLRSYGSGNNLEGRMRAAGMAEGGIVRGKGGPTDDEVPMRVGGVDVNLSNKEAVLPVKTVHALGGPEAVEELIERTNGKPPVRAGLRQGGDYNRGGFVDDQGTLTEPNKFQKAPERVVLQQQLAAAEPAAQAVPAGQTIRTGAAAEPAAQPQVAKPAPTTISEGIRSVNPDIHIGQGLRSAAESVVNNPYVQRSARFVGKAAPYLAGAVDASGVADVATDPNKTKTDVATEVARDMGRWGTATAAATAGAGASLPFAPLAGPLAPVVPAVAGLASGALGYFGADKAMDAMSGELSPSSTSYGSVKKTLGLRDPNSGVKERAAHAANMVDGNGTGTFIKPVFDKKAGDKELRAAKASGRFDAVADAESAELEAATKAGNFAGQNKRSELITKADQDASDTFGNLVDQATGVSRGGDGGLRGMAQRFDAYTNNDTIRAARNAQMQLRGDGTRFEKDSNGKLVITNSGDFDGSTKMPYVGVDGKPTSDWSKTQQFADGTKQAEKEAAGLRKLQYENNKFNATSDQITDPGAREAGLRGLAQYDKEETLSTAKATAAAKAALDNAQLKLTERGQDITLASHKQLQKNSDRAAERELHDKRVKLASEKLDFHAPTVGLKDDALLAMQAKRADLQRAYDSIASGMTNKAGVPLSQMNDAEYDAHSTEALNQARLSVAVQQAMRKDKAAWNLRNIGQNPRTSLNAPEYSYNDKDDELDVGGYKVKGKDVWGDDEDLKALVKTRAKK